MRSDVQFNLCQERPAIAFADTFFVVERPGIYTITDTVPGSNGCDSVVALQLYVGEPYYDTICEPELASYTWDGRPLPSTPNTDGFYEFFGTMMVDGAPLDTVAFLKLTVYPEA